MDKSGGELGKDKNRFNNIALVRMVAEQILKFVLATKAFILKKCTLILLLGDVEVSFSRKDCVDLASNCLNRFAKLTQDLKWMGDTKRAFI